MRAGLARLVFSLDRWLRRRQGIFEYSSHPECMFRLQIAPLRREVHMPGAAPLAAGERVLVLHLHSEHVPVFARRSPSVPWALDADRRVRRSLAELADWLEARPDLADIRAVRADTAFGPASRNPRSVRLAARYGFLRPLDQRPPSPAERAHILGTNVLITLLVLARNPGALRGESLLRDRAEVVLPRETLMRRFGRDGADRRRLRSAGGAVAGQPP